MPKGPVETPITNQEIAFAHLVLAGTMTDREAAEAVGIAPGQAAYVKGKLRVKEYMASHRASVREAIVQHESAVLAEFNIGREQLLAKAWEFACIDPKMTGYNTTSQSKALDFIWKALGYDSSNKKEQGEPADEPDVYKPMWALTPEERLAREKKEAERAGPLIYEAEWLREDREARDRQATGRA